MTASEVAIEQQLCRAVYLKPASAWWMNDEQYDEVAYTCEEPRDHETVNHRASREDKRRPDLVWTSA